MGAIDHKNAIKPVGKIFHGNASACDTDDELLAEPELELELDELDGDSDEAGGELDESDITT